MATCVVSRDDARRAETEASAAAFEIELEQETDFVERSLCRFVRNTHKHNLWGTDELRNLAELIARKNLATGERSDGIPIT